MRVIAGICRGMKLKAPQGEKTRPTADRVKESLFNIISSQKNFNECKVLDICAGTGSLGIESLSRGAQSCSFIEQDRKVSEVLRQNLIYTRLESNSALLTMEACKALRLLSVRGEKFDLIFLDPPYKSEIYESTAELLCTLGLLADNSLFIAECSARIHMSECLGTLIKTDRRVYGDTALEFFSMEVA